MDVFHGNATPRASEDSNTVPPPLPPIPTLHSRALGRSRSGRPLVSPPARSESPIVQPPTPTRSTPNLVQNLSVTTPSRYRFLPRVLTEAFSGRRGSTQSSLSDVEKSKVTAAPVPTNAQPPKLEYVKLPGTKGAVLIKAVETAKKR